MDHFWAAPPVARTYAAVIFVVSLAATLGILPGDALVYHRSYIFKLAPELWRVVSSMCLTGGLGMIFMPYSIWQYGIPLERDSPRFTSASFLVYLIFVGSVVIGLAGEYLGAVMFTGPMVMACTYTYAQENRGRQIQFFIMPLEVKYLPYAMLFVSLIQGGPDYALTEATGIVAAHLYDFLTEYWPRYGGGRSLIPTPAILDRMFENIQGATKRTDVKGHGTSFQARSGSSNASSATASGVSNPLSFSGTGRRLGSE